MTIIDRNILKIIAKSNKSALLLGPRQTGKSTLLGLLRPELSINLADQAEFLAFAADPTLLKRRLNAFKGERVLIDEIQRLPSLLHTIQTIIDAHRNVRFLLTGSSATKLRRGQANLLPGRLHVFGLGPLVASELAYELDTQRALSFGTLPGVYLEESDQERARTLSSYAATYLKEEIQAEALTRNIEGFARFLRVAAVTASQYLDLRKLSDEAQINHQSARRYFEVLEDTLIVRRLEAFAKSDRRRLVQHPRYVFFDNGVLNGLLGNFVASDDRKGMLFENFMISQVVHGLAAADDFGSRLSSYRTDHGAEVDLVIERSGELIALEFKASRNVGKSDVSGLLNFAKYYGRPHRAMIGYLGDHAQVVDGVDVLPWQELMREIAL